MMLVQPKIDVGVNVSHYFSLFNLDGISTSGHQNSDPLEQENSFLFYTRGRLWHTQ